MSKGHEPKNVIAERVSSTSKIGDRSLNNSYQKGKGSISEFVNAATINGVDELR